MRLWLSTPPVLSNSDSNQSFDYAGVKSLDFRDGEQETPMPSINFKSEDPKPQILHSLGSGRTSAVESVSFQTKEIGTADLVGCRVNSATSIDFEFNEILVLCMLSTSDSMDDIVPASSFLDPSSPEHMAAMKLQKVYRGVRTRRKLADCAVIIEQSWWKLLDYAKFKHSSISFFEHEKQESPSSRWARAGTKAGTVGKGLSKNKKARKLAVQHWLEAIDPRHRYGHNLHFYYVKWLNSQSNQAFFYWLDIGEGKEIDLIDECPRSKLKQQCIKYLGPMERKAYEVALEDGKLFYRESGNLIDTAGDPEGIKWIFVLSASKVLYVGIKRKGRFQHSSFLAGGVTLAAGRLVVEEGNLKAVWPHSGHYCPTPENFQDFISFLKENNVDLTDVKLDSTDEDEESSVKKDGVHSRSNSSEDGLVESETPIIEENEYENLAKTEDSSTHEETKIKPSYNFSSKITNLRIPSYDDLDKLQRNHYRNRHDSNSFLPESFSDGEEPSEELEKDEHENHHEYELPSEELGVQKEEIVSAECIIQRINSHSSTRSFQLGQHLPSRWSTGAGPRIGCVRDYPSGLQSHALEQVNLSLRNIHHFILNKPSQESS